MRVFTWPTGKTLILLTLTCFAWNSTAFADQREQQKELEELRKTIAELRKQLDATKSDRDDINKALESSEKDISELNKKAGEIEAQLKNRQQNLDELREEKQQLNQSKRKQEALVADYIVAAYRLGQQSHLRMLLNQEDPARVARNMRYHNYFASARAEKINTYVTTIKRIEKIEPEIAYQTEAIRADLQVLEGQKRRLEKAQAERKIVLAKLNAELGSQDKKLRALSEDRRQLEQLLSRVIENIGELQFEGSEINFASLKGRLPWPTKGNVVNRFGSPRVGNRLRWDGVLIASNAGNPVHAVHYGRVIFSDYLRGHGLLIILDHGKGFMSLYAHNQTLYKELGEWVESGDIIATVGNSGGQKHSALYFELRHRGKPTNPQVWFKKA